VHYTPPENGLFADLCPSCRFYPLEEHIAREKRAEWAVEHPKYMELVMDLYEKDKRAWWDQKFDAGVQRLYIGFDPTESQLFGFAKRYQEEKAAASKSKADAPKSST
jgi:hypothetical protein